MSIVLIVLHIVVCFALILIVLLQTGKGADMGAAFGGGASQTLFGTSGASTFLGKATTVAAIIFMLTSLALAYVSSNRMGDSVMEGAKPPVAETPAEQSAESTAVTTTETGDQSAVSEEAESTAAETSAENETTTDDQTVTTDSDQTVESAPEDSPSDASPSNETTTEDSSNSG